MPGAFQVHYATDIQSGFDGDFINITNDGSSSTLAPAGTGTATTSSGNLCVGVYFFDPNEELQACCACEVTTNGLISLSVKANNARQRVSRLRGSEAAGLVGDLLLHRDRDDLWARQPDSGHAWG